MNFQDWAVRVPTSTTGATTGFHGETLRPPIPNGIGSTPGTTAERGAWTSSALKTRPSMSTSSPSLEVSPVHLLLRNWTVEPRQTRGNIAFLQRPSTSGPQAVCATSTVVTVTSSSLRTSTAGSGLPTRSGSTQQTDGHSMTGLKQEGECWNYTC